MDTFVGELAEKGQDFPVVLGQAAEIDRIKNVAVEDKLPSCETIVLDPFQEVSQQSRLAVAAAQVKIREDYGIQHQSVLGRLARLPC